MVAHYIFVLQVVREAARVEFNFSSPNVTFTPGHLYAFRHIPTTKRLWRANKGQALSKTTTIWKMEQYFDSLVSKLRKPLCRC
mmetsp:Transcript_40967/g.97334  ORF Transcript_40967/g.97334 Transcript_40967/m.97334 type:complete len:83 (+) Transcript_40967:906-1154(+)